MRESAINEGRYIGMGGVEVIGTIIMINRRAAVIIDLVEVLPFFESVFLLRMRRYHLA